MCAKNTCGKYNSSWMCPPACGELAQLEAKVKSFSQGFLVQTVVQLEDSFDFEGMAEAANAHAKRFLDMWNDLGDTYPDMYALGAGACMNCKTCTYPDAPCRFPDRTAPSMESAGLFVSRVCKENGLKYNYGPDTLCYTSCYLFK